MAELKSNGNFYSIINSIFAAKAHFHLSHPIKTQYQSLFEKKKKIAYLACLLESKNFEHSKNEQTLHENNVTFKQVSIIFIIIKFY